MVGLITGTVSAKVHISGTISSGAGDFPPYTGEYTVTPKVNDEVTLPTSGKRMTDNVKILKVPLAEVTNPAGGITITLGDVVDNGSSI